MAVTATLEAHPTERRHRRRAVVASAVGTAIEWYDFFLYGFAAALLFPTLFFPGADPYTGVLLAFSTYFVGFVARPIGAALFGHYGDRIGRKATLVASLALMGVSTFLVGLMPTYHQIGIWGGIGLTLLRTMQGIGVGGEWGGSVLLALEWGRPGKRGFTASWPQFGVPVGLLLANGALAFFSAVAGPGFLSWGWRIPFLLSALLVGVGLYIRLGILETPVFSRLAAEQKIEPMPVVEVLRRHWREVLLTALLRTGQQSAFYLFTTFILAYGTTTLGMTRATVLTDVLVASALSLITVPLWGYVSDRVGHRRLYLWGGLALALWSFPYFWLLDTRAPLLVFVAIALALPIHDIQYGPQAAFIALSFPGRLRYSGSSLGYQLASIVSGGPAPFIALALLKTFHSSSAIGGYLVVTALIGTGAAILLQERSQPDLEAAWGATERLAGEF